MRSLSVKTSLALLCVAFAPLLTAQSYEIVLGRPTAVGATYGIVASASNDDTLVITRGDEIVQRQAISTRIEFAAGATVLELDEFSQPIRIRFLVERCRIERDGGTLDPFPAGTELTVSLENGSRRYTVGDEPIADDLSSALSLIHSLTSSDELNDQIFGTTGGKKVGDTWQLDAMRAAEGLAEIGLPVRPESIQGETTLVDVIAGESGESFRIEARLAIDDLDMPDPPGFRIDHSSMTMTFTGSFPVDTSLRKLEERMEGVTRIEAIEVTEREGPKLRMVADGTRVTQARYVVSR